MIVHCSINKLFRFMQQFFKIYNTVNSFSKFALIVIVLAKGETV